MPLVGVFLRDPNLYLRVRLGCRVKASFWYVGPGPTGGVPSVNNEVEVKYEV